VLWDSVNSQCIACSCGGDFNYDGILNIADLLVFFTLFGTD
jgi:hypothetical protein